MINELTFVNKDQNYHNHQQQKSYTDDQHDDCLRKNKKSGNWFTCNHHTTLSVCFLRDSKCTLSPKFLFSCGWRILPRVRPWRKGECSESRMSYITETTDVNMQNTQFWILSLIPLRKSSNNENLFGVFVCFETEIFWNHFSHPAQQHIVKGSAVQTLDIIITSLS